MHSLFPEKEKISIERLSPAPTIEEPETVIPYEEEVEEQAEDLPEENVLPQPPKQDQTESESEHKEEPKKKKGR